MPPTGQLVCPAHPMQKPHLRAGMMFASSAIAELSSSSAMTTKSAAWLGSGLGLGLGLPWLPGPVQGTVVVVVVVVVVAAAAVVVVAVGVRGGGVGGRGTVCIE